MDLAVWLIALLLLSVGIALLVRGIKGYAIDDHPICRRCGFDLFGLPAGGTICSECGASLSLENAVRIGTRQRRSGLSAMGVLLILPVVLGLGLLAWGSINRVKWIELQPSWYLLRQTKSTIPAQRDPALVELSRRIFTGFLGDAQIATLTDTGLAVQADLTTPWIPKWGDVIERARASGKLPDEKWKQYLLNAPQYRLVARSEIRRTQSHIPVRIEESPSRCGSGSNFWAWMEADVLPSDLVSPEQESSHGRSGHSINANGSGSIGRDIQLDPQLVAAASDGPQTLRLRLKLNLYENRPASDNLPPAATTTVDLQTTWNLVPADATTVKIIDDPSQRAAVEKCIKIEELSVTHRNGQNVRITLSIQNPPVSLAHKIFLRSGDREWPIAGVYVLAGRGTAWSTGGDVSDFDADVVDVIFRPDLETALNSVDMVEYWNGEAVIKDVKVERKAPGK